MRAVRKKGILNGTNDAATEGGIIARLLSRHDSFSNYHRLCALSRFFGSLCNMEFKSGGVGRCVWGYGKDVSANTVTETQMLWWSCELWPFSETLVSSFGFFFNVSSPQKAVALFNWGHDLTSHSFPLGLQGPTMPGAFQSTRATSFTGVHSLGLCQVFLSVI